MPAENVIGLRRPPKTQITRPVAKNPACQRRSLRAIESQGQQINKMDEKLNTLEARILRLKRELYECKQEAVSVL